MKPLIVWIKNNLRIVYENNKYSLFNDDKILISEYDSITPCTDYFFVGYRKYDKFYKYQLFNVNGDKIFGDDNAFSFISYNQETNVFTFFDYFKKITLSLPILSYEKNKLFTLFLSQLYSKKINDIEQYQEIIDEISNKIDNYNEEDINKIITNLDLTNKLYIRLNKPNYLKDFLIVLDEDGQKKLLKVIMDNKYEIFKDLTKDIIWNPKIYELNKELLNGLIFTNGVKDLNQVLVSLDSIHDKFEKQFLFVNADRYRIFSSLDSIREYFEDKTSIKYFGEDDFIYLKKNRNLFLNIMYNDSNKDILDFIKFYSLINSN